MQTTTQTITVKCILHAENIQKVSKRTYLKQFLKMTVNTETTMVNHWLGLCIMEVVCT